MNYSRNNNKMSKFLL